MKIGQILIENGVITGSELNDALDFQRKHGGLFGQALVKLGYVDNMVVTQYLAKQLRMQMLSGLCDNGIQYPVDDNNNNN